MQCHPPVVKSPRCALATGAEQYIYHVFRDYYRIGSSSEQDAALSEPERERKRQEELKKGHTEPSHSLFGVVGQIATETAAGRLDAVAEGMIDAASCVSGCGPAWVYQFIEALADGGVACGLPRAKAQEYAAQMVLGSAKLVLESGKHPGALKDAVCSPGGSTIQGVRVLEEHGLRGAVMDAVLAAYDKTKEMGKG